MTIDPPFIASIAVVAVLAILSLGSILLFRKKKWGLLPPLPANILSSSTVSPVILTGFRFFTGMCFLGYCVLIFFMRGPAGQLRHYQFLTVISFTLDGVYMLALAIVGIIQLYFPPRRLSRGASLLTTFFIISYTVLFAMSIFIDVVLWGILYPLAVHEKVAQSIIDRKFLSFGSYLMHGGNLLAFLIEFGLNKLPIVFAHAGFIILYTITYVVFIWILVAATGIEYPYPIMETSTWAAPGWYTAMAVMCLISFGVIFGLYKLKTKFVKDEEEITNDYIWDDDLYTEIRDE